MQCVPRVALLGVAILAACGSRPPAIQNAPGPRAGVRTTPATGGAEVFLDSNAFVKESVVRASVADVWKVLPQAWNDAMIPVAGLDTRSHTIQSGEYRAPNRIVGKPMSDYLDCGYTAAGPRVMLWQVSIDVTTTVIADSAGARVASRVIGTVRPRDGSSTSPVTCNSRGQLERIITGNVRVRLGL